MVDYASLVRHLAATAPQPFGLLAQQSTPTAGLLRKTFGNRLKSLFSPEHGWYGLVAAGERTDSEIHPIWHIPVHSLYGASRRPSPEMFAGISRVVVDLQDIGVRCYTYLATLKNMLEAAATARLPVTVLDRPIPLGGPVDGPLREDVFSSFVAPLDIPLCHGMTPGECATYIVREERLDLDLTVIRMADWSHAARGPWPNFTPPSPSIRNWDCAALYPATVFTEAYPALDCDRDGPFAFRVLGAPWLDVVQLFGDIGKVLPSCGIGVRPLRYRPAGGNYKGQVLDGLIFSIENPNAFYPVTAGTIILNALMRRHGGDLLADARPNWLDKLAGTTLVRAALASGRMSDLIRGWVDAHEPYLAARVNLYA
ncbi:MAG: exo-beta-N-acetylmuramidase NamZ domain-containing protein [Kiritimatiellia bacterium]